MQHPYLVLRTEYETLLATMRVQAPMSVDHEAKRILAPLTGNLEFAEQVAQETHVPAVLVLALDSRESGNDPTRALGQGDRWNQRSVHAPAGHGPFQSRVDAAVYYLNYDHVDDNAQPWAWPYVCWKGEAYNGFGPRNHGIHTGYLWACTNHYRGGKYTHDGVWDAQVVDQQVGIVPLMRRLIALEPKLQFDSGVLFDHIAATPAVGLAPPGVGQNEHDTGWLQTSLNAVIPDCELMPLRVDGSYGRRTREAVREFQRLHGLEQDGLFGPVTEAVLKDELAKVKL